jgi:thymidylate synthase
MLTYQGASFPDCYAQVVEHLVAAPDRIRSPRGLKCAEITPALISWPIGNTVREIIADRTDERYLGAELMWYYEARRDAASIAKYASLWDRIKNPDGTVNSAYGWHFFRPQGGSLTQWQRCFELLRDDPDTRQAIMTVYGPEHMWQGNPDVPCTLSFAFQRIADTLNGYSVMRSNDVWYGLPYDAPFFASLVRNMAALLDLRPGLMTHYSLNLHAYEKNLPGLAKMLDEGVKPGAPWPRQQFPWLEVDGTLIPRAGDDPLWMYARNVSDWMPKVVA